MQLMTIEIESTIPQIGFQDSKGYDAIAYVKFFTPDSNWTWYATEYDPVNKIFFGLVKGFEEELGYFSLEELESSRGPLNLAIERDLYYTPKPLKELLSERNYHGPKKISDNKNSENLSGETDLSKI
jgi:hypothetical protein